MDEETLRLLTDLHLHNSRQGPGSERAFRRALDLAQIDTKAPLHIADIGCGTGSATIPLLEHTRATVTAVDLIPAFLEELVRRARAAGVEERLVPCEADMTALPFQDEQFDVLWSEGAIYNVGFAAGVEKWRRFLKPGGVLAVSEITWLTREIPRPLQEHWDREYPQIAPASEKFRILEEHGYTPIGYFTLTPDCWLDEYYMPLEEGFADFLERNGASDAAHTIVEQERREIALYKAHQQQVSYGFYLARKAAQR